MTDSNFSRMHNDYLDPDKHELYTETGEEEIEETMRDMFAPDYQNIDDIRWNAEWKWQIQRAVYKYTDSGVSCHFSETNPLEVTLSGYCEGSDAELETYHLTYPFSMDEWYKTIEQCETDAIAEWNATHGCDTCLTHWKEKGLELDEWGNTMEIGFCQIWADCPECKGYGIVI